MKKVLTALLTFCLLASSVAFAADNGSKGRKRTNADRKIFQFGPTVGMSFMDIKNINKTNINFQGGLTAQINIPVIGLSIQPSVTYHRKSGDGIFVNPQTTDETQGTVATGYLNVPVAIQWGPDLMMFRPYVEAVPYFGYALHNSYRAENYFVRNQWDGINRFEFGAGVGVGVEIWRFQLSYRYFWNFTNLTKDNFKQELTGWQLAKTWANKKYKGSVISLTFFF